MLSTNCEIRMMENYLKNKLKERLTYCKNWKHSIDMYLASKEITKQANDEFYKTRPFLKFLLDAYYLPYNLLILMRYLRIKHDYKKNEVEMEVLTKRLK